MLWEEEPCRPAVGTRQEKRAEAGSRAGTIKELPLSPADLVSLKIRSFSATSSF